MIARSCFELKSLLLPAWRLLDCSAAAAAGAYWRLEGRDIDRMRSHRGSRLSTASTIASVQTDRRTARRVADLAGSANRAQTWPHRRQVNQLASEHPGPSGRT
jgi:hypothetical protein